MKKVQVTLWNNNAKQNEVKEATFLHWGVSCQELNNGIGHYTVVFVMLSDGTVEEVSPRNIKFEVDEKKQKLEAAAPDLLAACNEAATDIRVGIAGELTIDVLEKAIKKATE